MTVFTAVANAPRLVAVGGDLYRVPAATLADFAELAAFVEARVPAPPGSPCAPLSSDAAQDALAGPDGLPLVVFLALSRCQPVTLAQAREIAYSAPPADLAAVRAAFYYRRPRPDAGGDPGRLRDLTEVAWGRNIEALAEKRPGWTYRDILALSLDQYDVLVTGGRADETWEGRDLGMDEVQKVCREAGLAFDEATEPDAEPDPGGDAERDRAVREAIDRFEAAQGGGGTGDA